MSHEAETQEDTDTLLVYTLDMQWMTFKENIKLSKHSLGGSITGNLFAFWFWKFAYMAILCIVLHRHREFLQIEGKTSKKNYDLLYCHVVWNQTCYISETCLYQENQQVIGVVWVNIPKEVMFCLFLPLFPSFNFHLLPTAYPPEWKQCCLLKKWYSYSCIEFRRLLVCFISLKNH